MNNKAFRYRIYPDREQEILFRKTFGCTRFVWNRMLSERNEGKPAEYPAHYKKEFEWLREVDSLALCNVQRQLTRAFADFCRGKSEHPKFKTKTRAQVTYTVVYEAYAGEEVLAMFFQLKNSPLNRLKNGRV